jgi:hypothetical protein
MRSPSWPGVGKVDLELTVRDDDHGCERYWIEVKWHDLWNSPWDVAKLALALREGLCDRALLIAAAPASEWQKPGAEFFGRGRWDMATDVLGVHRRSWLYWKKAVKTRPLRLRSAVETVSASRHFAVKEPFEGWSVRAAELGVDPAGWIEVDEDRRPHVEFVDADGARVTADDRASDHDAGTG